jgi:hypothetical protein
MRAGQYTHAVHTRMQKYLGTHYSIDQNLALPSMQEGHGGVERVACDSGPSSSEPRCKPVDLIKSWPRLGRCQAWGWQAGRLVTWVRFGPHLSRG